jgi:hypothetical protein
MTEKDKSSTAEDQQKRKHQGQGFQGKRPEGEKQEHIPVLKYGKGNNYYQFQQALYKKALKDYGDLVKLITLNKNYVPRLRLLDYTVTGLAADKLLC